MLNGEACRKFSLKKILGASSMRTSATVPKSDHSGIAAATEYDIISQSINVGGNRAVNVSEL